MFNVLVATFLRCKDAHFYVNTVPILDIFVPILDIFEVLDFFLS